MSTITLGGQSLDTNDPCALYEALYAFKLRLIAGERQEEVEITSPLTRRRVRFTAANPEALDAELERLRAACDARLGAGPARPRVVYFNTSKGL
ncbi:hypothetical protein AncyloWKF20_20830 [Ancylobacter sp. WKF20]|uniref:hypothetical protein n=1 Tax=Ancylobacter sp. WKF20 TaxID=3039801 RepID=UPI002434540D|nr:hypothetical protein [Ancylobacter sp. WKF20]WGD30161.1 hypothetical protein AncyloWKF20_20830 [Ancylobacter sp. WKF20]